MDAVTFELKASERDTPVVDRLRKHYEARIAELRAQNDDDLTSEKTWKQRGRIAEAKAFLALFDEKPEFKRPVPVQRPPR